jgi:hypothetical protein
VSAGLTVCYSFHLLCFVLCGDFNFVPSYSVVETSYNIFFGIVGLLIISIFGGSSLMWRISPTPSVNYLPYYLKPPTTGVRTLHRTGRSLVTVLTALPGS